MGGYYTAVGNLISEYEELEKDNNNLIAKQLVNRNDVYPVFREIFKKREEQ